MDIKEFLFGVLTAFLIAGLVIVMHNANEAAIECSDRGGKYYDGLCLKKDFLVED